MIGRERFRTYQCPHLWYSAIILQLAHTFKTNTQRNI